MKNLLFFLYSMYASMILLSGFSYLLDIVLDSSSAFHQPQYLLSYLVYFTIYRSWLIGLIILAYELFFYRSKEKLPTVAVKLVFILASAAFLAVLFHNKDINLTTDHKFLKSFLMYSLTGASLLVLHRLYWKDTRVAKAWN